MENLQTIIEWYDNNVNISIPHDIFDYMVANHIVNEIKKELFDDFLLKKMNGQFLCINGKYQIKENRYKQFSIPFNIKTNSKKYKLNFTNKNNIQLIKLN